MVAGAFWCVKLSNQLQFNYVISQQMSGGPYGSPDFAFLAVVDRYSLWADFNIN